MELKKLMVDSKSAWIDFPGLDGFSVEGDKLVTKRTNNLRKRLYCSKFDRKTRQLSEVLDEDKFVEEFARISHKELGKVLH